MRFNRFRYERAELRNNEAFCSTLHLHSDSVVVATTTEGNGCRRKGNVKLSLISATTGYRAVTTEFGIGQLVRGECECQSQRRVKNGGMVPQ